VNLWILSSPTSFQEKLTILYRLVYFLYKYVSKFNQLMKTIIKLSILFLLITFFFSCTNINWDSFNQSMRNVLIMQNSQALISKLNGSVVIAEDGTYLGKITYQYESESIFNEFGKYGSSYSPKSIWNKYGTYGSKYSSYSSLNPYTSTPPKIFKNGFFLGYLTVNKYLNNAINPYVLSSFFD